MRTLSLPRKKGRNVLITSDTEGTIGRILGKTEDSQGKMENSQASTISKTTSSNQNRKRQEKERWLLLHKQMLILQQDRTFKNWMHAEESTKNINMDKKEVRSKYRNGKIMVLVGFWDMDEIREWTQKIKEDAMLTELPNKQDFQWWVLSSSTWSPLKIQLKI